ncbi:hypothetical protein HU200_067310 [Digitaria exilis]|uniref:RING-type E3 ubiquitin transferase n=1 Tax=Digitaria exilis TaxID=1010633 RepID=A0A835DWG7_9POAL|nr:hypothetical protein HU200_067310 [Digitaria exilis]
MLNLYPRHRLQESTVDDLHENVEVSECYNPFYAIAVVCVSIFLFCVLAASVNVWKALAIAALAGLLLGVVGCFAPKGWFRRPSGRDASATELVVVTVDVTAGAARPGHPCAQVNAPPAFAFQCPLEVVVCSVCLEDVRGGEMVRLVPACGHVFHVGCIDMWLHSHRTCPVCRCVVSTTEEVSVSPKDDGAVEEAPESSDDDHELPPV